MEHILNLEQVKKYYGGILAFVNVVIIFVICFLINYTTKFMFEKRIEFDVYKEPKHQMQNYFDVQF